MRENEGSKAKLFLKKRANLIYHPLLFDSFMIRSWFWVPYFWKFPKKSVKSPSAKKPRESRRTWRKNSAKLGENTAKMTLIFWLTHAQSMSKKLWVHSKKSVSEYEWAWVEQFSKCVSMSNVSSSVLKSPWVWVKWVLCSPKTREYE